MSIRKWDVVWALLDPGVGHEQAGRRPALVFCSDITGASIGLATVLHLTAWKEGRRVYPTEVLLPAGTGGLPVASLVLAHQVRPISAQRVSTAIGSLGNSALRGQVATPLRLWLDLTGD